MVQIDWSNISVAIWGKGEVADAFVKRVRQRFPGVIFYDREEELKEQAQETNIFTHLEVADIDAVFTTTGRMEQSVIRCLGRHRCFNYEPDHVLADTDRLNILLVRMIDVIPGLILPLEPPVSPVEEAEPEEEAERVQQ